MVDFDTLILSRLLDEAWKHQFLTYPNPPVAACIIKNHEILSFCAHKRAGKPHAEVLAFKEAFIKLTGDKTLENIDDSEQIHEYLKQNAKNLFQNCSLYITLEPCNHYGKTPPCSELIEALRPKRVVFAHFDPSENASGGCKRLQNAGISVKGGIHTDISLLEPFSKWQTKPFIFFKLAMRLNGTIDGTVSSLASRQLVHKIRDIIDLLLIGGNTVRTDRPILDARLCGGRAPDVQIYSKQHTFDQAIPLFSVPDRKVIVSPELSFQSPSLIMVEGGASMFEAIKDRIDWVMLFSARHFEGNEFFTCNAKMQSLHTYSNEEDLISFLKPL